jgi:glutathione synthase
VRPVEVYDDKTHWYDWRGEPQTVRLGDLDAILMRKDPPFDLDYIAATYILERAVSQGVLVANRPRSLRDCNEKVFITSFPQCTAPTLVARDDATLRAFHADQRDIILKPLEGMGGSGIFRVRDDGLNLGAILETLTDNGRHYVMAQRYLPEIADGDKRILVVDGEAVPYALARIPKAGETRGNLAAGGTGRPQPLTERDRWIVGQVAPALIERGLLFVGLDVIGDFLTEINVTSPTCAREIEAQYPVDIGGLLIDAIDRRLARVQPP